MPCRSTICSVLAGTRSRIPDSPPFPPIAVFSASLPGTGRIARMRPQHCLFALLCAVPIAAHAQLRTIPGDAKAGLLRYVNDTQVAIDGVAQRLAPGEVHRVWILTPEEAAKGRAAK